MTDKDKTIGAASACDSIRKDGIVYVSSSIPGCGYDTAKLQSLRAAGYEFYINGKRSSRPRPKKGVHNGEI